MFSVLKTIRRKRALKSYVEGLGEDKYAVREALYARRVVGTRSDPHDCAIARAILDAFGGSITVETGYIQHVRDGRTLVLPTPAAITQFIRAFDKGDFPELVAAA